MGEIRLNRTREGETTQLGGGGIVGDDWDDDANEGGVAAMQEYGVVKQPRLARHFVRERPAVNGVPIQNNGAIAILANDQPADMTARGIARLQTHGRD